MNDLISKQFEGHSIRSHIDENGQVWFIAADLIEVLGIKYQAHALRKLDDSDKGGGVILPTSGGNQEFATVSESGLYALIFQSKKPAAKKFKFWVTNEVLPSIRKTGSYAVQQAEQSPLDILENHVRHMRILERANNELSAKVQIIAVEAKQEHDTLTHDQITELTHLIGSLKDVNGEPKDCGKAMKMLKARFGLNSMNTWKEMPRHGFEEAKLLVRSYRANLKKQSSLF